MQEVREKFFEKVDVPPRPCGMRSDEIKAEIFSDQNKAMLFSSKIQEAFNESGIELKEDETFACLLCVIKKPQYVSEVMSSQNSIRLSRLIRVLDTLWNLLLCKR